MPKSLDQLIDWLLGEIVFGGDQGISVAQFLDLVDKFYGNDDKHGIPAPTNTIDECITSGHGISNTDYVFKSKIWQWLVARPDIYVGDDREGNKLTLDQVLTLPISKSQATVTAPRADSNTPSTPAPEASTSDVQSIPPSSQPQLEGTPQPTDTISPAKNTTKTKKPRTLMFQPRIQVSQDRQWHELTGHGVDTKKVPVSEWRLLCTIAATRGKGIAQGDLVRASGQDKRSVPRRTDFLAQKGYIEKRQILLRNQKTSLLTHIKFIQTSQSNEKDETVDFSKIPANILTADLSPITGHEQWTGGFVDEEALVKALLAILRAWGVMQYTHLRQKLYVQSLPWQMKVLARNTRRLVSMGVIKRVDAKLGNSDQVFKDCIKIGRDMTEDDWASFRKKPTSLTSKGRPREDIRLTAVNITNTTNADELNDVGDDSADEAEDGGSSSIIPKEGIQWAPNKPLGNILYDVIHASGPEGLSGMQARKVIGGDNFEKPMYRWLDSHSQPESQPVHLDHLSIVRDVSQTGKNNHYQYISMPNFQKLVDEGKTSWETVRNQSTKAASTVVELDDYGFTKSDPNIFEGPNGCGTLLEATLSADHTSFLSKRGRRQGGNGEIVAISAVSYEQTGKYRGKRRKDSDAPPKPRGRPPKAASKRRGRPAKGPDDSKIPEDLQNLDDVISSPQPDLENPIDVASSPHPDSIINMDDASDPQHDTEKPLDMTSTPRPSRPRGRPPKKKNLLKSTEPDQLESTETSKKRRRNMDREESDEVPLRAPPDPNKLHKATFTSYDDMQREEGVARVYISPTGSERFSRIGRQGRPPRSLVAVFKSNRLKDFEWIHQPAPPVKVRTLVGDSVSLVSSSISRQDDSFMSTNAEDTIVVSTGNNEEEDGEEEDTIGVSTEVTTEGSCVDVQHSPTVPASSATGSPTTSELLESQFVAEIRETASSDAVARKDNEGIEKAMSNSNRNVPVAPSAIATIKSTQDEGNQPSQAPQVQQPVEKVTHFPEKLLPPPSVITSPITNTKKRKKSMGKDDDSEKARSAKKIALTEAVRALGSAPPGTKPKQTLPKTPYRSPYDPSSYTSPFAPSPLANELLLDRSAQDSPPQIMMAPQTPKQEASRVPTPNTTQTITSQPKTPPSSSPSRYISLYASQTPNHLGATKGTYNSPYAGAAAAAQPSAYQSPYAMGNPGSYSSPYVPKTPSQEPAALGQKTAVSIQKLATTSTPPSANLLQNHATLQQTMSMREHMTTQNSIPTPMVIQQPTSMQCSVNMQETAPSMKKPANSAKDTASAPLTISQTISRTETDGGATPENAAAIKAEEQAVRGIGGISEEEKEFARILEISTTTMLPENAASIHCLYDALVGNLILSVDKTKLSFIPATNPPEGSGRLDLEISNCHKAPVVFERKSKPSELRIYANETDEKHKLHVFRISRSIESHTAANSLREMIAATMTSNGTMPAPRPTLTLKPAPGDGGKPWLCEKCGNRWRNDIGLLYHLQKSNGPCNPNFVPKPLSTNGKRRRTASVDPGQSSNFTPSERAVTNEPVEETPSEPTHEPIPEPNAAISDDEDDDLYELTPSGRAVPQNKRRKTSVAARASPSSPSIPKALSPSPSVPKASSPSISNKYSVPARLTPWELHAGSKSASDIALKSVETSPSTNRFLPPLSKSRMQKHSSFARKDPVKKAEKDGPTNYPAAIAGQRRKDTILELLNGNNGVFPGMKSLWFAFVAAWLKKFPSSGHPEMRVVNATAASLIDSGIIRKHEFAFRDSTGRMKTRVVLTKEVDPSDPIFIAMKKEVIDAAPDFYVPPAFLPSKELLNVLEDTANRHGDRSVSIKTAGSKVVNQTQPEAPKEESVEVLVAPFYNQVVKKETRRVRKAQRTPNVDVESENENYEEDAEFEEEDDDPYGMSTPLSAVLEEQVSERRKRPWNPEDQVRRAKQSAILKAAWAARKAQGLPGKIQPGWKLSNVVDYDQIAQDYHESDEEYDKIPDVDFDYDAGDIIMVDAESDGEFDASKVDSLLSFNGASFEEEIPRKTDKCIQQTWQGHFAFLQDESGAWSRTQRSKRKRELRPQLPEPITLIQTPDNEAWGTHAFGHGVRPIYSRPARRVEGNKKSESRYENLLQGHRPVLLPESRMQAPIRQSFMITRPQNMLVGVVPRQKRKYTRRSTQLSRAGLPTQGIWQLESRRPFKPPVRPNRPINLIPHIAAVSSCYFKFLEPNTALDEFSIPEITYPVIVLSPQIAVTRPRFAGATTLRQSEDGFWKNLPESVFELLEPGSFNIKGWMPSHQYFLNEVLPSNLEDIMKTKLGKRYNWEHKPDPQLARFFSEVDCVEKWEQGKDMQALMQGSIAPKYRWINHSTTPPSVLSEIVSAQFDFHPQEQLSWRNPPWDDESNYPDEGEIDMIEHDTSLSRNKRQKVKITEASQKAKDRRAMMARYKTRRLTQLPQDTEFLDKNDLGDGTQIAWDYKPVHGHRSLENAMSEHEDRRLIVAVIVIRTLTGGYEKNIDWVLVARLFPNISLSFANKRWSILYKKHRLAIEKLSVEFPDFFLEAYAADDVPPFDPDDALGYDWNYVVDWVLGRDDVSLSECHSVRLPDSSNRLKSVFNIEKKENDARWRDGLYGSAPVHRRVDHLTSRPMAVPINKPQKSGSTEFDELTIARSVIRANCLTPAEVYQSQLALNCMNEIGDAVVKKALNQLLEAKVLLQKNKGRPMPGRAYDTTDAFSAVFRRDIKSEMLERACQFKAMLDENFHAGRTVLIDYNAQDGDILCITNLQSHGRVSLIPSEVPANKFGLTDGDYMVRHMDKTRLRFKMTIVPTSTYLYDEQITVHDAPRPDNRAIPIWYDIHGTLNKAMWKKTASAVFGMMALRSGANIADLVVAFAPSVEEWELRLLINWGAQVGVLREVNGGWSTGEWWWWVAGRD